jgi:universal stress protein A
MSAEVMSQSSGKVLGIKVTGKLSDNDYKNVFLPEMERVLKEQGAMRMLISFDEGFSGFEPGAMWEDMKFGATHLADAAKGKFEKIAMVGGSSWERRFGEVFGHLMPGEVKGFTTADADAAWDWLKA